MIINHSKKMYISLIIACSLSAHLYAMQIPSGTTGKSYAAVAHDYTRSFFKGWVPTLTMLTGATWYTLQKDRQAPIRTAVWAKDLFIETDARIKYPALLLGGCWLYTYYKPRVKSLYNSCYDWYHKKETKKTS